MKNEQLRRLLELLRRTGERLIVADSESDEIFVLMNLSDYEKMAGDGNQPSLFGRAENFSADDPDDDFNFVSDFQPGKESDGRANGWPAGNFRPGKMTPLSDVLKDMDFLKENPDISPIINEEPLDNLPEDEEEKFYLEPVE